MTSLDAEAWLPDSVELVSRTIDEVVAKSLDAHLLPPNKTGLDPKDYAAATGSRDSIFISLAINHTMTAPNARSANEAGPSQVKKRYTHT